MKRLWLTILLLLISTNAYTHGQIWIDGQSNEGHIIQWDGVSEQQQPILDFTGTAITDIDSTSSSKTVITIDQVSGGTGSVDYSFKTWNTPSGDAPVADSTTDTVTFISGSNIVIEGSSTDDSVTFSAVGGGDITDVGDCTGGACLDGTSDGGTWIKFYDAQGVGQLLNGNLTARQVWTLPDETGTVCTTGSVCSGYQASGSYLTLDQTIPQTVVNGAPIFGAGIVTDTVTSNTDSDVTIDLGPAENTIHMHPGYSSGNNYFVLFSASDDSNYPQLLPSMDGSGTLGTVANTWGSAHIISITGALTGNASTASALASDPANCSAGSFAAGVTAAGIAEGCTDVWTEAENTAAGYGIGDITDVGDCSSGDCDGNITWTGQHTHQNTVDSITSYQILDADGGVPIVNIDTTNELVGIGTAAPGNKLDIITGNTISSQFHFGEVVDEGGYLSSLVDSQIVLSAGQEFVSGSWTARATTASAVLQGVGVVSFSANSGLTDGNTFTPTERMRIDSSGNVGIGTLSPSSILNVDRGTGWGQITSDGSSGGCLMMRDTDDAGWTECYFLNGAITCSIDADGICDGT